MFNNFLKFFNEDLDYVYYSNDVYLDFIFNYSKKIFGNGLFRVVDINNLTYFNNLVKSCFFELSEDIRVIGFDWLGRIFVSANKENSEIYICDSGAHEILEVPVNIIDFFNSEIPEYSNELFSTAFYNEYISKGFNIPAYNQCIGYKIPLFLGGVDDISNVEKIDLDVFWSLMSQLWLSV